jgi:adenosine deaminase CECR1
MEALLLTADSRASRREAPYLQAKRPMENRFAHECLAPTLARMPDGRIRLFPALLLCLSLATSAAAATPGERFEEFKRTATPAELYTLLYALPKGGDLHNHFGGSILPEWWLEAAIDPAVSGGEKFYARTRFLNHPDSPQPFLQFVTIREFEFNALPTHLREEYVALDALDDAGRAAWISSVKLDLHGEGRDEFFGTTFQRLDGLRSHAGVVFAVMKRCMEAFAAEGVRYLEWQFGVFGHNERDGTRVPADEMARRVGEFLDRPDVNALGVTVRFQEAILRFRPTAEKQLEAVYKFVDANRDLWVGINMVGIEERGPGYPKRFLEAFRRMRTATPGIPLSIHAGEMDAPNTHVRDTLVLGATRIGHAVNLIHDPDTMLLMRGKTLVEINLISNQLLEYTPDVSKHPFPEYLRTGIPVCLNTDDRGMWDSNLTDEYYTAVTVFNLSWDELVSLGRNSLVHSFVQPDVKAALLEAYEDDVQAFEAKMSGVDWRDSLAGVKPVTYGYAKRMWGLEFAK